MNVTTNPNCENTLHEHLPTDGHLLLYLNLCLAQFSVFESSAAERAKAVSQDNHSSIAQNSNHCQLSHAVYKQGVWSIINS